MNIFKPIWQYREFIWGSVVRDFEGRYKNSLLGFFWSLANPIFMISIYTLVFSSLMQSRLGGNVGKYSYSIYICTGILAWGLFSEIINRSLCMFIENANILKKLSFPRITLPASLLIICGINFLIIFGLFSIFLALSGNFPGLSYLGIFPLLAILSLMAIGIGIFFGMLNVFFRDVGQFFTIFMQLWFWCTPIVYPLNILPEAMRKIILVNPVIPLISSLQDILVEGSWPNWGSLWYPIVVTFFFCFAGLRIFQRHGREMVDEL